MVARMQKRSCENQHGQPRTPKMAPDHPSVIAAATAAVLAAYRPAVVVAPAPAALEEGVGRSEPCCRQRGILDLSAGRSFRMTPEWHDGSKRQAIRSAGARRIRSGEVSPHS